MKRVISVLLSVLLMISSLSLCSFATEDMAQPDETVSASASVDETLPTLEFGFSESDSSVDEESFINFVAPEDYFDNLEEAFGFLGTMLAASLMLVYPPMGIIALPVFVFTPIALADVILAVFGIQADLLEAIF